MKIVLSQEEILAAIDFYIRVSKDMRFDDSVPIVLVQRYEGGSPMEVTDIVAEVQMR